MRDDEEEGGKQTHKCSKHSLFSKKQPLKGEQLICVREAANHLDDANEGSSSSFPLAWQTSNAGGEARLSSAWF